MTAPARVAAFHALRAVDNGSADLPSALAKSRQHLHDERDRSLTADIVTGTLRWQRSLDHLVEHFAKRPLARLDADVITILRLSLYQLLHLTRVPGSAVVDDAVDLVRLARKQSATGFVNAVLRALSRERGRLTWPERPHAVESEADTQALILHLATVHSHPAWLVERWLARHGADNVERWLTFNNRTPVLCLAANLAVASRDELASELANAGVETKPTRVASYGLTVSSGHPLTTRAFLDGHCVVQDEASQVIAELAAPKAGGRMLDLCASPGGKTIHFAARAGESGVVVASDVRPHRIDVLRRTLQRCHASSVRVVHIPATSALPFRTEAFDTVFIDAPCSGLGTIRRDPDIRWKRTAGDLARFAEAQQSLLERSADLVPTGGRVIYSTCSSEPEENEDVIETFLRHRAKRHCGY